MMRKSTIWLDLRSKNRKGDSGLGEEKGEGLRWCKEPSHSAQAHALRRGGRETRLGLQAERKSNPCPAWEIGAMSVAAGDAGGTTIKDRKWMPGQADRRAGGAGEGGPSRVSQLTAH